MLTLTAIERMSSLAPPKTSGIASETTWIWADSGSTKSGTRTTTVPRSKGPATPGVTTASESGAPLYGPARKALPAIESGEEPLPAAIVATPTWLSAGQLDLAFSAAPARAAAAASAAGGQ